MIDKELKEVANIGNYKKYPEPFVSSYSKTRMKKDSHGTP
jgi:hypothetical protein